MFKFKRLILCLCIFINFLACVSVPYTQRKQLLLIPESTELELGIQSFNDIIKTSKISNDPYKNALVRKVGVRIAKAANKPDYKWEFIVISNKTSNAFCLPGGKIAIFTGLFKYIKNETSLATVISHEIAHVLARHAGERMSQDLLVNLGAKALDAGLGGQNPTARQAILMAFGLGSKVGILLPYSRKQEEEADRIGLILMAKAGYDPRKAIDFWQEMMKENKGNSPPEFLSTHPSDIKRVQKIKEFIPEAMAYLKPED